MCPPLYLNSGSLAQQEKKVEAAAVVLKWSQTAAVLLEGHMQGVLASMTVWMVFPIRVVGVAIWSNYR